MFTSSLVILMELAAADAAADAVDAVVELGEAVPLSQREPTLPQLGLEANAHFGMIGSAPTRFVDELRFGAFDWLELRTALLPYPSSLIARARIGSQRAGGAVVVDAGLAHWDLTPDELAFRAMLEAGASYSVAASPSSSLFLATRYRYRITPLADDDQQALGVAAQLTYDVLPGIAVTGGVAYASALGGSVRENAVLFAESDRPGITWLLGASSLDGHSLTTPVAVTFSRTESFDLDVFATTELYPELALAAGAGVRVRF